MICLGDMNIDLLKPECIELLNVANANAFNINNKVDVTSFTRRGKSSLTIIDHCYADIPDLIFHKKNT